MLDGVRRLPARRKAVGVALVASLALVLGVAVSPGEGVEAEGGHTVHGVKLPQPAAQPGRPNIVLLLVDDLDVTSMRYLPGLRRQTVDAGTSFTRAFVTDSLCCPSRTSILRGQYVHNHGVVDNTEPDGGYVRFADRGLGRSTIGTWMHDAGYRTSFMGKFLNAYPQPQHPTRALPGWDDWHAGAGAGPYDGYRYTMVENGRQVRYGDRPRDYEVDVLSRKASAFVSSQEGRKRPFFLYLAPYAPHAPANPAERHRDAFPGATVPRTSNFNPEDVSGLPVWERLLARMGPRDVRKVDKQHRNRLRSMLGVQDMVERLVRTLRRSGQLDNTYLVFASDNGFHLGQHRLGSGKRTAYEEDIRVPLVVRGPGVPAGRSVRAMASTLDLAPTIADLAGGRTPAFVDGRSLVPMLHGGRTPASWRRSLLVERSNEFEQGVFDPDREHESTFTRVPMPSYTALRTTRYTYVEYHGGAVELYDTRRDPQQLHNIARTVGPALVHRLHTTLRGLARCSGKSCRSADRRR